MSLPDELLALASHLANLDDERHHQASLRRAVSTAYYALFHLLVSETTLNWRRDETRSALGRLFEHRKMKGVCDKKVTELNKLLKDNPRDSPELTVAKHLLTFANTFVQVFQERNDADYDTSKEWDQTNVLRQIDAVSAAFKSWEAIKHEPPAQAFLFSPLARDR
jgi:uncharacterized protein (UPF0332 family)